MLNRVKCFLSTPECIYHANRRFLWKQHIGEHELGLHMVFGLAQFKKFACLVSYFYLKESIILSLQGGQSPRRPRFHLCLNKIMFFLPHSAWAGENQAEWAEHLGSNGGNNQISVNKE